MAQDKNTLINFLRGLIGRSSDDESTPTYKGLTVGDIKNWQEWIEEGKLTQVHPEEAKAMLKSLSSMESGIREFLLAHEKTLEKLDYEDEFLQAIQKFIAKTNLKLQALSSKPAAQFTEEDITFLENMAILFGQESKLSGIQMKRDAPQKQLLNRLGIWKKQVNKIKTRYEQRFGPHPGFYPQPRA